MNVLRNFEFEDFFCFVVKFSSNCDVCGSLRLYVVLFGKGYLFYFKCYYGRGVGRLVDCLFFIIEDNSIWFEYFFCFLLFC